MAIYGYCQSEHKCMSFTTESTKRTFNLNTSTAASIEVLESASNNKGDTEFTKKTRLVLNNYVQISPPEKISPAITVQ